MRILGIDPSLSCTGWAIIQNGKVVKSGTIKTSEKQDFINRIREIADAIFVLLCRNDEVKIVAIEDIFVYRGKSLQTPIKIAKVHGAILAALHFRSTAFDIYVYSPSFVKQTITGKGNASKEQVLKMVQLQAGYKDTQLDESDAAAVALTCERELTNGLIRRG